MTREVRSEPEPPRSRRRRARAAEEEGEEGAARYERSKFLEGATLGLGAVIGAVVTLPVLGFAVAPAFIGQDDPDVDLGPLDNYPEGAVADRDVHVERRSTARSARRTAFIRNNGLKDRRPELHDPLQPLRPPRLPDAAAGPARRAAKVETTALPVELTPTQPSGFGCPCHGGAYDIEGNRVAGPPVRALDRYEYSIVDGNLVLGAVYSVGEVDGKGADAEIVKYSAADPGVHVDGPEQYFYPYVP